MKKRTIVIIHLVYWVRLYVYAIPIISLTKGYGAFPNMGSLTAMAGLWGNFITQIVSLFPFYITYFFLFPQYFVRRKYFQFAALALVTLALTFLIDELFFIPFKQVFKEVLTAYGTGGHGPFMPVNLRFSNAVFAGGAAIVSGSLLRALILWFDDRKANEELERKNLQTELALLRAQINPHFLFNTLNNIDILIEKQPVKASEYLKKLSDIMRFSIYEASSDRILLNQELEYIEKYIDLQRIRSSASHFIKFEVVRKAGNLQIAPMLFIPFIENAFKHSTNKKQENAIDIVIRIIGNEIFFSCANTLDEAPGLEKTKGGAGLDIIKNRLTLIYPDHVLHIDKTGQRYIVNLSVKLDEN